MSYLILLALLSSSAMASQRTYNCENVDSEKISFTVSHASDKTGWEIDGTDSSNPFVCYFKKQHTRGRLIFDCQRSQGSPLGYLTIKGDLPNSMKATLLYVDFSDETEVKFTGKFSGICSSK